MSLETDLFASLASISALQRAGNYFAISPVIFPQPARYNPEWPALRYTFISSVPVVDICGDGDDTTADVRVQLDVVATTYVGMRALRLNVMLVMASFVVPAILQSDSDTYDPETQTYRCIMDYLVQPSSTAGSP